MKEKKPFIANKNHFCVFIGLFLCLFSAVLVLNTGIVARILSTPFTFVFGSLAYVVYLLLIIIGLRFIFARKATRIRFNSYMLATIVMFAAVTMFFAHFVAEKTFNTGYIALAGGEKTIGFLPALQSVFDHVEGGYYNVNTLMLFSHPFASGIIGYFLIGTFNTLFGIENGGLIFAIVIAGIAYLLTIVFSLFKKRKVS